MANYQHAGPAKGECYGTRPGSVGASIPDFKTEANNLFETENKHCGKHDKIFTDKEPCPGCESEKQTAAPILGADDTLAEQRGTLPKKSKKSTED